MITTETRAGISIVRLDRPERLNAMVPEMIEALIDKLRAAAAQAERPIVLTGTGSAFCSGADVKWLASLPDPSLGVADLVAVHHLAITSILELRVPLIAAVNGVVAGGGIGLVLACDYSVVAEQASFIAAYTRLGLTPDGGASAFLERTIGLTRTRELLLTNRRLSAQEAREWGLVNEVVPDDQVLERAAALADELPRVPGYALVQARRLLDSSNLRNQLQLESVAIRTAAKGDFFREALRRFSEA